MEEKGQIGLVKSRRLGFEGKPPDTPLGGQFPRFRAMLVLGVGSIITRGLPLSFLWTI